MALANRRKRLTLVVLSGVVCGMVGLSFAAVPLYDLFCSVTGFGGTTQTADVAPAKVGSIRIQGSSRINRITAAHGYGM